MIVKIEFKYGYTDNYTQIFKEVTDIKDMNGCIYVICKNGSKTSMFSKNYIKNISIEMS